MRLRCFFSQAASALLLILSIGCTRDYDPFLDTTNARAYVHHATFSDAETLDVFGADTIKIAIAVSELVDSFNIESSGNRFFNDTSIAVYGHPVEKIIPFYFSFNDTGAQHIAVYTYLRDGEEHAERMSVYLKSPLSQAGVNSVFGSPVHLETQGVDSRDVRYHWDFGRGVIINSPYPDTAAIINDAGPGDTGFLWVSDLSGNVVSPATGFTYSFNDTSGPSIFCISEGYTGQDTIPVGRSNFSMRFSITDRGEESGVYQALIDGRKFDLEQPPVYTAFFGGMDTVQGYVEVIVEAVDNAQYMNGSRKSFWIYFDAGAAGSGIYIEVLVPPRDTVQLSSSRPQVYGLLWNYTGEPIDVELSASVNGVVQDFSASFENDSVRNEWILPLILSEGLNRVSIYAVDPSGETLSDTGLALIYSPTIQDSTPPEIIDLSADGERGRAIYSPETAVYLRVVAFDAGSGLRAVEANGTAMQPSGEGGGYIWGTTADIAHKKSGNLFTIIAYDRSGYCDTSEVTIYRNNAPELINEPSPSLPIFTGREYKDDILIRDRDYDLLDISLFSGPDGLDVDKYGKITWLPGDEDTGVNTIVIFYSDGYEPRYYSYQVIVMDTSDVSVPAFSTTEQDFNVFLEAGRDTLSVPLTLQSGRGTPPYTFHAAAESGITQPYIDRGEVRWAPVYADTGFHPIIVTVIDMFERGDTLIPVILVVPPNRPCSLSVTHGIAVLPGGAVDLSGASSPVTFLFQIHDEDNPLVEKHTISASSFAASTVGAVDSNGKFAVIIDPSKMTAGNHFLVVTVTDRENMSFSLSVELYVGQ